MYIIDVIPIARGTAAMGGDTLSYFTTKDVTPGALVSVPLRSRSIQALVVSVRNAEDMKSDIKQSSFVMKKVEKLNTSKFLSPAFMNMVNDAAHYYATSVSEVLNTLLPEYLLKNSNALKPGWTAIKRSESGTIDVSSSETYAVQGDDDERFGTWKSLIRQEFAKKSSVFIIVPSIEDAVRTFELIEKGIEGYAFVLHGALPKKTLIDTWNAIVKETHPVAVVMTGGFLALDRPDVSTIVIEKENARGYKRERRPFLDIRHVAELLVKHTASMKRKSVRLFVGDILLRAETLSREADGDVTQASPFKFRSLSTAHDRLIDMRTYKNDKGTFKILSDEVEHLIVQTKNDSEHMMILATRRGVAGTTVCGDCQNVVTCTTCSAPIVLHKVMAKNGASVEKNFFLCHHCGERRSAEEYCKVCGSWKLGTVGIGIDLVHEKIKDKFPEVTIFRIDTDTTPTEKQARDVVAKFRAKPGSILLGTEMMLSYVHDRVENSAVVSYDSLLALPDFRIQEKILYSLVRARARTTRELIVQTRKPDERLFEYALKGNLSDFYRLTLDERKKYNYPPFSTLIKLTLEGKREAIVAEMASIQEQVSKYPIDVFPAFTHTVKGNQVLHALIRLPRDAWPDRELEHIIRSFSPSVTVNVDPDSLL